MDTQDDLEEYQRALRDSVCSRCIEKLPQAPPCGPRGKGCGIERHLTALVGICHEVESRLMDPYIEKLHNEICMNCEYKDRPGCPCPLDYLLQLAVEAIEKVDRRRAAAGKA
jgi:hypothetical protein